MPKKKAIPTEPAADDPARFEEALAELEGIVTEMEGERLPLAELLKKYERGSGLLQLCQGQIGKARERIEQIAEQAKSGDVTLEPFDPDSDGSTETAASVSKVSKKDTHDDDDIQLL